ncbi:MAG: caspase family protein [Candidatus Thiodiazotropha sp. (ex Semelilucina semeliformis)]|nr:caspase family protein [Candidatus Thiodiazotropha sp. (ex Semelilucina semeliformis)]
MKRAAVVIGVDKTGGLPKLNDAAKGARRFAKWARTQGVDPVKVITDQRAKVTIGKVKDAVKSIVNKGNVEQLLVYFAGHGVNIRYSEYWLLSDAPDDPDEAVNVRGSALLAAYCGIPHVILISDACRTAADGIQAQFVTGGQIFPNEGGGGLEQPVDQFFACTLGRPAHELKNPAITTNEYKALYTGVLLDSLQGTPNTVIDWADDSTGFVRPRKLKQHLYDEVTQEIARLGLQTKIIQVPDARITSDSNTWLAKLKKADVKPPRRTRSGRARVSVPDSPVAVSQALLDSALDGEAADQILDSVRLRNVASGGSGDLSTTLTSTAAPFGPMHHETQCGFKIRGALFTKAYSKGAWVEEPDQPIDDLRVQVNNGPYASVLLTLDTGAAIVLPAISEFLCALTIDDGELVDVAYEPSANSHRWSMFEQRAADVRTLRAVASSSTLNGVFRLDQKDALKLARQMQYAKSVDPALAVYAAYAYQDLQRTDLIKKMCGYMQGDIGARFFDLALLAGELRDTKIGSDRAVMGFVPLLAQGWAQLAAHRVSFPQPFDGMERYLLNSPWTMFNPEGAALIHKALKQGVVL